MVFEMYFSNKIDVDEIVINAESGTLSVSIVNTKKFGVATPITPAGISDHTRSVINFYKAIINPSCDYVDIDIALKNKAGQSYEADTEIYIVVYGVAGTQNDVDLRLCDRFYYIKDKKILFERPIDMGNKNIENANN